MKVKLNRSGIESLLKRGQMKKDLCAAFFISRPTLDMLLDDKTYELRHPGMTLYINARVSELLKLK